MSYLKDKAPKPPRAFYPRDGDVDTFPGGVKYAEDPANVDKFLIRSDTRLLSLWESQLDALGVLLAAGEGEVKVLWAKAEGTNYIMPTYLSTSKFLSTLK